METPHTETVVDKAVNFVKDVFGIEHDAAPEAEARPEYTDTAPEVTTENAMRLDPNTLVVNPAGEITPNSYVNPIGDLRMSTSEGQPPSLTKKRPSSLTRSTHTRKAAGLLRARCGVEI